MIDSNGNNVIISSDRIIDGGNKNFEKGDFESALTLYNIYLKGCPNNHTILYNKGCALFHLGKLENAKVCFEEASSLVPNSKIYKYAVDYVSNKIQSNIEKPYII